MSTATGVYSFNLGAFHCAVIADGREPAGDLGFVNATSDEVAHAGRAWSASTGGNADEISFNILLIDTGDRRILVDTGNGPDGDGQLLAGLAQLGYAPESIDIVVITHAHGDHINANVTADGQPVFPNARYVISGVEWEHATQSPSEATQRQLLPLGNRVDRIAVDGEIAPGVHAVPLPGHTPGQIGLLITSNSEALLHLADAFHHPVELPHPQWYFSFDHDAAQTIATRRAILERAARDGTLVATYHLPYPGLGHVVADGDAWHWEPLNPK